MEKEMKTPKRIRARIKELTDKKNADLNEIKTKSNAATEDLKAARQAIQNATEKLDVAAYEKGKAAEHRAQTAIDLYGARFAQLQGQRILSIEESDKVIDSLLDYEDQLATDFRKAVAEPLKQLRNIVDEYQGEVRETEDTIRSWTQSIRGNYRYIIGSKPTGNTSSQPIPVHITPFLGCDEARALEEYLEKAAPLLG